MRKKVFILLILFLVIVIISYSQNPKSVLDPESYNEARLNRLQPPDQVMDAISVRPGMTRSRDRCRTWTLRGPVGCQSWRERESVC